MRCTIVASVVLLGRACSKPVQCVCASHVETTPAAECRVEGAFGPHMSIVGGWIEVDLRLDDDRSHFASGTEVFSFFGSAILKSLRRCT